MLAMGFLFCLFGGLGGIGSWGAYSLDHGIEKSGASAVGHTTDKSVAFSADGDSDYVVDYWFQLPTGERVEAHRGVHKALWSTLRKGESFVVLYSVENPNRNFPRGGGVTSVGLTIFVSALSTLIGVFGVLLVAAFFRGERGDA